MTPTSWRSHPLLPAAGLLLFATACASIPSGRFDSLAAASQTVLQSSVETYARIENLQRRYMLFNPAEGPFTVNTFKPQIVDDQGQMRDFDLGPRLRFRESALEVLAKYAEALQAFAKKDYQGDLDKASQELGASIAGLSRHLTSDGEAKQAAGILATAVNGLGRAIVERRRRQALRKAMGEAQQGVTALAKLIADDNTELSRAVTIMRGGILRAANRIRPDAPVTRLHFDQEIALVTAEADEILLNLSALNAAVERIPPAHAEIMESLERDDLKLKDLQALIAEAKRISKFYRSVK